ncbi:hypothetical protein SISNIDRAFT_389843, partial [Sistotremastrum niveocremeum HHB9708]
DGDLILRTSDGVDFNIHKLLLGLASAPLRDMTTLGDQAAKRTDVVVVSVPETSEIFTVLLRYIYPVPKEHITSLDQISALMDVAQKYDLQA